MARVTKYRTVGQMVKELSGKGAKLEIRMDANGVLAEWRLSERIGYASAKAINVALREACIDALAYLEKNGGDK